MRIIYPYPMHLSNGYTYMLSISQFLNELSEYANVNLLSLDDEVKFREYLQQALGLDLNPDFRIEMVSNRRFGIKSNKLFFSDNVLKKTTEIIGGDERTVFYTRDFKQMRALLRNRKKIKNARYVFEVHQILSQNYAREGEYSQQFPLE